MTYYILDAELCNKLSEMGYDLKEIHDINGALLWELTCCGRDFDIEAFAEQYRIVECDGPKTIYL